MPDKKDDEWVSDLIITGLLLILVFFILYTIGA